MQREHMRRASGILVPIDEAPAYRCTICGAEFSAALQSAWQYHVGKCAREHLDELRAEGPTAKHAGTVFDPEQWDPEYDAHLRKVGERMVREGNFEYKRGEK